MSIRSDIEKRIAKLETETGNLHGHVSELFGEIEQREFAVQELQALLKNLPPDDESEASQVEPTLRKGSDVAKSREVLRKVRSALHVDDLLRELGKPVTKKTRASLSGQLSIYARKGQVFTRPEPNTFGLKEWENKTREQIERAALLADGPYEIVAKVNEEDLDALPMPKDEPEAADQAH